MMETVAEVALRGRIAELERELMRARNQQPSPVLLRHDESADVKSITTAYPAPVRLVVAASWQCDINDNSGTLCLIGEAHCKGGVKFSHNYYVQERELLTKNAAVYVLGDLHMRVVRTLAEHYK